MGVFNALLRYRVLFALAVLACGGAFFVLNVVSRDADPTPQSPGVTSSLPASTATTPGTEATTTQSNSSYAYVALGDSYAAGEGLAPYIEGTDTPPAGDDCHRSQTQSYVEAVAAAVNATRVMFVACSGAQTANIFQSEQRSGAGVQAPQGLLDATTRLVTISIGGNDMEFSNVVAFCIKTTHCNTAEYTPNDQPAHGTSAPLGSWAAYQLDRLHGRLHDVFAEIHQRAPQARVLVVGYPHLFGDTPSHDSACQQLYSLVDSDKRSSLNGLADALNATIQLAAQETGAQYVDVASFFKGHEPCALAASG